VRLAQRRGDSREVGPPPRWREVPRLDFLPRRRRAPTRRQVAILALLGVLGLEVWALQVALARRLLYEDYRAASLQVFQSYQSLLREAQTRFREVEDRLNALRQEREELERLYRQATAGRVAWGPVVAQLLEASGQEVLLTRIRLEQDRLLFTARAQDLQGVRTFQERLLASPRMRVEGLGVEEVVPEEAEGGSLRPYLQITGILRPAREAP